MYAYDLICMEWMGRVGGMGGMGGEKDGRHVPKRFVLHKTGKKDAQRQLVMWNKTPKRRFLDIWWHKM